MALRVYPQDEKVALFEFYFGPRTVFGQHEVPSVDQRH